MSFFWEISFFICTDWNNIVRKFSLHYLFDIIVFDTLGAAFWFGNPFLTTAFPIQLTCMVELRVCKDIIPAFDLLKVVSHLMLVWLSSRGLTYHDVTVVRD